MAVSLRSVTFRGNSQPPVGTIAADEPRLQCLGDLSEPHGQHRDQYIGGRRRRKLELRWAADPVRINYRHWENSIPEGIPGPRKTKGLARTYVLTLVFTGAAGRN